MESLHRELERLERKNNLQSSIDEVDSVLAQLRSARSKVVDDASSAQKTLLLAQGPIKQNFDKMNDNLKDIYNGLNKYGKAIKDKFRDRPLPFGEDDSLDNISSQSSLVNRAIAMHFLREGLFDVASAFISEANANPPSNAAATPIPQQDPDCNLPSATLDKPNEGSWTADFSPQSLKSGALQQHFASMYQILDSLRARGDLDPAIAWARSNSALLEARGSNLEFDLCRLRYIALFNSQDPAEGPLAAVAYARATFPNFPARYAAQTRQLLGALAFAPSLSNSPYAARFGTSAHGPTATSSATENAVAEFTTEFCALLSLSSASPLFTAVTAGAIALPTLAKFAAIRRSVGTSWTTDVELPVEVPLPRAYVFHAIFVCPVSKEQATDANPPMMMPCGHVIARDSIASMSSGRRFKCPYCPSESLPGDAMRIYL